MKGIDIATGKRLSEVASADTDESNKIAAWIGPGHVQEFYAGIPNCMVIDSEDKATKEFLVDSFSSELIRFYYGEDMIGNEIGAAANICSRAVLPSSPSSSENAPYWERIPTVLPLEMKTSPSSASYSPVINLKREVLPLPLEPIMPSLSFSSREKETFSNMVVVPKRSVKSFTLMAIIYFVLFVRLLSEF